MDRPDYLKSGEPARLFPVLANSSKEGRTTSIFLACMTMVDELASELLRSIGQRHGTRSKLGTFTEVVFDEADSKDDRPDGLIVLRSGKREWRALVETKIGKQTLSGPQIEAYRRIAKANSIDCVITISNQFTNSPSIHPLSGELNKRIRVPVFHWSWKYIRTVVELLAAQQIVEDRDQVRVLRELARFLEHDSAGVESFSRMPPQWAEIVRLASTGGKISKTSPDAMIVVDAWHQETRDLSLVLTNKLGVFVSERVVRTLREDKVARQKQALALLSSSQELISEFDIPDAASTMTVVANLASRSVYVGMKLKAPEDKVSSSARLRWLLRQLKGEFSEHYTVRFHWPGRAITTEVSLQDASEDPSVVDRDRSHLQVGAFEVCCIHKLGARFGQQANFITDLEHIVPEFYELIGQNLTAWVRPAPKIKEPSPTADDDDQTTAWPSHD